MASKRTIIVYHSYYGCETGCCGHTVEIDEKEHFFFEHPYNQDPRAFAEQLLRDEFGEDHVADLDWENCRVNDGC